MIEFKSQQIHLIYNTKMHRLAKVLLITVLSAFFTLVFFDYSNSETELKISSKINCINLGLKKQLFVCNTCFEVSPKNKTQELIRIESQQPFIMVSLKEEISKILSCEQWLQAVQYQTLTEQNLGIDFVMRLQPSVHKFLTSLQKQHNQILDIQKAQISTPKQKSTFKLSQSLQRPYQVISYYQKSKQVVPFRVFQTNEEIRTQSTHIITLLAIAANIAVMYSFHCLESKSVVKKYSENVFGVVGIVGVLLWIILGDINGDNGLFQIFCRVLFFSLSLEIVFGGGRWIFFGIVFIINFIMFLQQASGLINIVVALVLLFIICIKVCSQIKQQYYHLEKNSNKKIYLLVMTLLVVGCYVGQFIEKNSTVGQIFRYLSCYLILLSFFISIKNLDGDTYHKLLHQQRTQHNLSEVEGKFQSHPTTTVMYEDHETLEENQLPQIKH